MRGCGESDKTDSRPEEECVTSIPRFEGRSTQEVEICAWGILRVCLCGSFNCLRAVSSCMRGGENGEER